MQVSVYYPLSKGMMRRAYVFSVSSISEARRYVNEWFLEELENAEWNIKQQYILEDSLMAVIDGYTWDEHVVIRLEDDDEYLGDEDWDLGEL